MMKLNKIQVKIYNYYKTHNKTWVEAPRQSGKTTLLVMIAVEEISNKKEIVVHCRTHREEKRIQHRIAEYFITHGDCRNYPGYVFNEILKNIFLSSDDKRGMKIEDKLRYKNALHIYDEMTDSDILPKRLVSIRTPTHPTLNFTYIDVESKLKKEMIGLKNVLIPERWLIEYGGGIINHGSKEA